MQEFSTSWNRQWGGRVRETDGRGIGRRHPISPLTVSPHSPRQQAFPGTGILLSHTFGLFFVKYHAATREVEMVGTQPGLEDTADPVPGDRLLPYAVLDSKGHTLVSASSPPLASGKLLHPRLWCAGFHSTCYALAGAMCSPNSWGGG